METDENDNNEKYSSNNQMMKKSSQETPIMKPSTLLTTNTIPPTSDLSSPIKFPISSSNNSNGSSPIRADRSRGGPHVSSSTSLIRRQGTSSNLRVTNSSHPLGGVGGGLSSSPSKESISRSQTTPRPKEIFPRSEIRSSRRRFEFMSAASRGSGGMEEPRSLGSMLSSAIDTSHVLTTAMGADGVGSGMELYDEPITRSLIWGTTISVQETMTMFRKFLHLYMESGITESPYYMKKLQQMTITGEYELELNCQHLMEFPQCGQQLYDHLVKYPEEMISLFDVVATEEYLTRNPAIPDRDLVTISVRPYNLEKSVNMRDLDPEDIDKLISIKGLVIRATNIIPDLMQAFYQCTLCGGNVQIRVDRGVIEEPNGCEQCKIANSMILIHNRCKFTSKQIIRIQETPEMIPDGQTPHTITIVAYGNLVDSVRPGDRVDVTGVYRATSSRPNPRTRTLLQIYRTYIDAVCMKKLDRKRFQMMDETSSEADLEAFDSLYLDSEIEKKLCSIARLPNVYEILTNSLAPSIYELDDVKKGVLLQLFGGASKTFHNRGTGRFRGDINILLVGDPGTSKSQLLQYVNKIAPRGVYTSGKGSSAVGLTAYVTRDSETKQLVLESGALVLSDGGICCIDEFDKMSDSTRAILHEVMEQQTISIAKAGIICSLNARTAILASANPRESHYDSKISVVDNIQLPPTLLSRFDLIYLILDHPNEYHDRRLAKHIISLYYATEQSRDYDFIDIDTMTQYITYARRKIHPKLTDAAVQDLIGHYVNMRKLGSNRNRISATPRQLESMIRLAEAHARLRFSQLVEVQDTAEAVRLIYIAQQQSATDPITGIIDMDIINTGRSVAVRQRSSLIASHVKRFFQDNERSVFKFQALLNEFNEQSSEVRILPSFSLFFSLPVLLIPLPSFPCFLFFFSRNL